VRITRYPSIGEAQFFGCVSAFVDSLSGELNAAAMSLGRLAGSRKGSAFAYEMTLDTHRYGALIVLDRWSTLVGAFGPYLEVERHADIVGRAGERVRAAEEILGRANLLVDAAPVYGEDLVEACVAAFQAVNGVFAASFSLYAVAFGALKGSFDPTAINGTGSDVCVRISIGVG